MRTIKVCAGIGDNIWLLQKLVNSGEQFNFQLPDGQPQRGKQIFDLLPLVANGTEYVKGLTYHLLSLRTEKGKFRDIKKEDFYLSCNKHLEQGRMLKDWMPDLKLSYKLPWKVPANGAPYVYRTIGIYGSAYSTQRAWSQFGAWGVKQWLQLIKLIHKRNPSYLFVIVGAGWDNDFATELSKELTSLKISFSNTIGSNLTQVANMMQEFKYAFYFPSGLPILSESLEGGSDCTMFYTSNIKNIMGTWCDPARREDGRFKECLFCEPEAIFNWCVENNKI